MYLLTLTLKRSASEKQAEIDIDNIIKKIELQNHSKLLAVRAEIGQTLHPHYHILTDAAVDSSAFSGWDGRVQCHTVSSIDSSMFFLKNHDKTTFFRS